MFSEVVPEMFEAVSLACVDIPEAVCFPLEESSAALALPSWASTLLFSPAAEASSWARTLASWAALRPWGEETRGAVKTAVRPITANQNGGTNLISQYKAEQPMNACWSVSDAIYIQPLLSVSKEITKRTAKVLLRSSP